MTTPCPTCAWLAVAGVHPRYAELRREAECTCPGGRRAARETERIAHRPIAVIGPDGFPLKWSIRYQRDPTDAKRVRRALRRSAEVALGARWHDLWLRGYRIRLLDGAVTDIDEETP